MRTGSDYSSCILSIPSIRNPKCSTARMRDTIIIKSAIYSCGFQLALEPWNYARASEKWFEALCNYEPAMGSWSFCINENLNEYLNASSLAETYIGTTLATMNKACKSLSQPITQDLYQHVLLNTTDYFNTLDSHRSRALLNYPLKIGREQRHLRLNSLLVYYENIAMSNASAKYLFIYTIGVILLGFLFGIAMVRARLMRSRFISTIRSKWTLPAISEKHAQSTERMQGLIPTRLELCIIIGYLVAHMAALTGGYSFDQSPYAELKVMQLMRIVSDRFAILSFAQLPLIIIFSGRNSFVENLSGLRYTTSIVLHKWISRIMLADAMMHGVLYGLRAKVSGTLKEIEKEQFWVFGIISTYCALFLTITSIGILRRKFYETFLVIHIVLAIAFFWSLWIHVNHFGWTEWVWSSIALWIMEKVARLVRILQFGGIITSRAEMIGEDVIKLTIPKKSSANQTWKPGQYGFIYVMLPQVFWQSHPFSVIDLGADLQIVLKVKEGVTLRLHHYLKSNSTNTINLLMEGPYGESCDLKQYDSRLLLCGGSGIPGPLGYLLHNNLSRTTLVIVCRDTSMLEAYRSQILQVCEKSHIPIYVTRSLNATNYGLQSDHLGFGVVRGRPDINQIISNTASEEGSLAVITCGPPIFVDQARSCVANYLQDRPTKPIEYVEEYQIW